MKRVGCAPPVAVDKPERLAVALAHAWPHCATFVVSFLTMGIIWVNHHGQFHRVAVVDRPLLFLNLLLLMFVVLIPFPTDLLGELPALR